ncbi:sushi, von Willebrand factor type A, EGF and pentraxin domain-containing protein 1-like [Diadema antillarum]|uniref:sushi, von Willebrand factor type A, EGF and pentraxin domain-containing protein 1-like n=1 Tax=Diadema antillarum TaxID=105358 RepID=UPI003A8AAEAF
MNFGISCKVSPASRDTFGVGRAEESVAGADGVVQAQDFRCQRATMYATAKQTGRSDHFFPDDLCGRRPSVRYGFVGRAVQEVWLLVLLREDLTEDSLHGGTGHVGEHSPLRSFNELPADILLCPNDTVIETLESTLNVSWERPLFEGEDRENIVVSANVNTTWKVLQLGTHVIEYIAVNTHSGEETVCSFNITLEPPHCPTLEPPHNGALSCRRWPRGEFCSLSCDDGYDVPRLPSEEAPPSMYSCMNSKEWQPHSNVPDCSEERNRRRSNLPAEMYHTGDCADVSTQEQIALALMTIFRSSDSGSICEENDAECSINHVSVTCGSQDAFRELPPTRLNKRSAFTSGRLASMCPPSQRGEMTRKNVTRISFNIGLEDGMSAAANGDVDLSELREQLDSAAQNMASRFVDVLSSTLEDLLTGSRDIDSRLMEWLCEPVVQFGEVEIECDDGFVRQATSSLKCVACPRGFYSAGSECMPCAQGFYQDKPAQTSCEPCPPGQSTSRTGSKTMDSCTDKCPPGHFSPTGLVPCFPCSRLSYQSREGQRSCDPCPAHHLTNSHGAVSVKECRP